MCEYRVIAPNGHPVAVSTSSFGMGPGSLRTPGIRHAAICGPNVPELGAFFVDVFNLQKSALQMWNWVGHFLSDGVSELALLANAEVIHAHQAEMTPDHAKENLNHFGFLPDDVERVVGALPADAGATLRTDRPRPQGYYRVWDPDGNHFDIRASGWGG